MPLRSPLLATLAVTAGMPAGAPPAAAAPTRVTTIQSPVVALPADGTLALTFSWYLAHPSNSSSADCLRVSVVSGTTVTTVFQQLGAASNRAATCARI